MAPGNPLQLRDIAVDRRDGARGWRCGRRAPARNFSCLRFLRVPAWRSMRWHWSSRPVRPAPTSPRRCAPARADCGIATRAVAQAAGLDFVPLTWERFDLALRQRDYFLPGLQTLFNFVRTAAFRDRAADSPAMT